MNQAGDKYSRLQYRRLIAWPQRIQRETPLLLEVLGGGPSSRLLDLGCGTGEHARFLVEQGFQVVGVDQSESMIADATDQPRDRGLEFIRGDIRQLGVLVEGEFGGALCLGNTLPHLREPGDLVRLFSGLRNHLTTGAALLLQLLNYERVFRHGLRHLPVNIRSDDDGEVVFLRLMQPLDDGQVLFFPTTLELRPGEEPPLRVKAAKEVRLRGWRVEDVDRALQESGFRERVCYGSFDKQPFDAAESPDLIVVAS